MTPAQEIKNLQDQFARLSDAELDAAEILIEQDKYSTTFKAEIRASLKTIRSQRQQAV